MIRCEKGYAQAHATPLHLAVRYGQADCVQTLVAHGADPYETDGTGFSAFDVSIE